MRSYLNAGVIDKCGLTDLRFHDFRHMAATRLIKAGLSERQVMEIAGWTTNMLSTYYNRDNKDANTAVHKILSLGTSPLQEILREESSPE